MKTIGIKIVKNNLFHLFIYPDSTKLNILECVSSLPNTFFLI